MRLTNRILIILFMVNLVCWIGIALDYYNDKILNVGVHLILFSTIFTIGFILAVRQYTNEENEENISM